MARGHASSGERADGYLGRWASAAGGGDEVREPGPAAGLDGMSRIDAARVSGIVRQSLRDRVHRFNKRAQDGGKDTWSKAARHARHQTGERSWPSLPMSARIGP
jgi:hypothetical protein